MCPFYQWRYRYMNRDPQLRRGPDDHVLLCHAPHAYCESDSDCGWQPSGMAETARATPRRNTVPISSPRITVTKKMIPIRINMLYIILRVNCSMRSIRGGFTCFSTTSSAILPSSVLTPVASTSPKPRPRTIEVPEKNRYSLVQKNRYSRCEEFWPTLWTRL